jgi:hypothetical protein
METKHEKHHGSAFFWGLIAGALLATLLTTKKGRLILRELVNLALELIEELIEERNTKKSQVPKEDNLEEELEEAAAEDLDSEITEVEENVTESAEPSEQGADTDTAEPKPAKTNGNGHQKKRLFRGLRRK